MKPLFAFIVLSASTCAMQKHEQNLKRLDEISLQEFSETKKQIVAIAEKKSPIIKIINW